MSALHWSTVPYRRALPRPITTSHGVYTERAGCLLCVRDADGRYGLGDVAPLPGFSEETLDDVLLQWKTVRHWLSQQAAPASRDSFSAFATQLKQNCRCAPSLTFGIETALADLAARVAGKPLAQWLSLDAAADVEINALLHARTASELRAQATEKAKAGYHTFKLKVGMAEVAVDVERIAAVREAVPTASIRIDANAGWNESQFRAICPQIADFNLGFVEQPFPVGQAAIAKDIACEFGVRLALDEEAETIEAAEQLIEQNLCDAIVLKPMMVGGIMGCLRLAARAQSHDIGVVFTSAWESDVGLAATLHLAAAGGQVSLAAGLSTAGMIAEGLVTPALRIERARLTIPQQPGLGLELI